MTTMKLISKEKGIESVQKWFEIPHLNKIKKAVYRRSQDNESEFGNIVVRFHRIINGIPSGTIVQIWIDRNKGKVLMVHDPQEMLKEKGVTEVDTSRDVISAETAWLQLKDKIALSLGYRVHPYDLRPESPLKRLATFEYELQCNWTCDAITNQVVID